MSYILYYVGITEKNINETYTWFLKNITNNSY